MLFSLPFYIVCGLAGVAKKENKERFYTKRDWLADPGNGHIGLLPE
jgi:hypothetical protein